MTIREYKDDDKNEVAVLCDKFQDHLVVSDPEKLFRRTTEYGEWSLARKVKKSQNQKCGFYVVTDQNKVVGFIFGSVDPTPPNIASYSYVPIKSGLIEELYVDAEARGKGFGSALTSAVENFFKQEECARINLGVLAFNAEAKKFYEHLGYTERSIQLSKKLG